MSDAEIVQDVTEGIIVATPHDVAVAVAGEELNQLIMTAKANPRSIKRFTNSLTTMVKVNREMAESCHYTLERKSKDKQTGQWGKKLIVGASVRFAEVAMTSWGNMRAASQVVGEHLNPAWNKLTKWGHIIGEAACIDIETNTGTKCQVRVRVEMSPSVGGLELAFVAAQSKAKRNAILQMIPKGLWLPIFDQSKQVAAGGDKPLDERRAILIEYLTEKGAKLDRVLSAIGKPGIEDIDEDALLVLRTAYRQIHKNEATVDSLFPPLEEEKDSAADKALDKLEPKEKSDRDDENTALLTDANALILQKGSKAWDNACAAESIEVRPPEKMTEDELLVVLDALKA